MSASEACSGGHELACAEHLEKRPIAAHGDKDHPVVTVELTPLKVRVEADLARRIAVDPAAEATSGFVV